MPPHISHWRALSEWWAIIHTQHHPCHAPLTLVLIGELSVSRVQWWAYHPHPTPSVPRPPHIGTHWRALSEPSPMVGHHPHPTPSMPRPPHIGTHWRALSELSPMVGLSSTPNTIHATPPSHWYSLESSQ